jgi:hypothetical protein
MDTASLRRELVTARTHLTHKCKIEGTDLALLGAVELLLRVIDGTEADTSTVTVEGICAKLNQMSEDEDHTHELLYGWRDVVIDLVGLLTDKGRTAMLAALDSTIAGLRDRGEDDDGPRMAPTLEMAGLLRHWGTLRVIPGGKPDDRPTSPPPERA